MSLLQSSRQASRRLRRLISEKRLALRSTALRSVGGARSVISRLWTALAARYGETRLVLALVAIGLFSAVLPDLPRFGVMTNSELLVVFLGAIATVLAAIVAIVVAVAFLAVELLTEVYASYAPQKVLTSTFLRVLVTLYLCTIAFALIALASIGSSVPNHAVGLTYYASLLTLICLVMLYPASRKMLARPKPSREEIRSLAQSITYESLRRLSSVSRYSLRDHLSQLEEHPIYLLSEIGLRALRSGDRITPLEVALATTERLSTTVTDNASGDGQELRSLINAYLIVLGPLGRASLERGNQACAVSILRGAASTHRELARCRVPWYSCVELDTWLSDFACEAARLGLQNASREAASVIGAISLEHLKHNAPPEGQIWELFPDDEAQERSDHESSNQWRHVQRHYLSMLARIHDAACQAGEFSIATTTLSEVGRVTTEVERIPGLGPLQRRAVVQHGQRVLASLAVRQARAEKTGPSSPLLGLGFLSLSTGLQRDTSWAKHGILQLCVMARRLARDGLITGHTLNELGAIGRGCVESVGTDERFAEALMLISGVLTAIADDSVDESAESAAEDQGVLMAEIEKQLSSLQTWFIHKEVDAAKVEDVIAARLRHVRSLKESLSSKFREISVEWPSFGDEIDALNS